MKFHRFTHLGILSNWGWYSPQEKKLLAQEMAVGKAVLELEPFIRISPAMQVQLNKFHAIQTNMSVNVEDYATVEKELDRLASAIKDARLDILNADGDNIPASAGAFRNHHPDALIGEIQSFLHYQRSRQEEGHVDPSMLGFRIKYQQDPDEFHEIMALGGKVLYTVSIDDILTIGDPKSTKHSVVAAGVDCKAAGIAQLDIDKNSDIYGAVQDYRKKILILDMEMSKHPEASKAWQEFKDNRDVMEEQAKELETGLAGWVPPAQQSRRVLIDFDSGHYAPHSAWKEAMAAWRAAGYEPRWSPNSRRV
ncbi:hypothetical protein AAA535_01980 [Pseudomonas aeruginosa]